MNPNNTYGAPMAGASVTVAFTGTAGTTAALPAATQCVRVIATTDCFIEIGTAPTAVANTGLYLPAGSAEYFSCPPSSKVSAIQVTTGGSIYVTPFP
jgi:histidinol dehydrogenase